MLRRRAIALMTRVPVPGQTKTRMMPALEPDECARLHECFLRDIGRTCRSFDADLLVPFEPHDAHAEEVDALLSLVGVDSSLQNDRCFPQAEGTLGDRMLATFRRAFDAGYEACVLVGGDCPELSHTHLTRAFSVLDNRDVVLGPAFDGGFYLVGMSRAHAGVLALPAYGTNRVLAESLAAIEAQGLTYQLLDPLHDMDVVQDLSGFKKRMDVCPDLRETWTGTFVAALALQDAKALA